MRLIVIIGSTRPGRAGLPIGTWFAEVARDHAEVDLADLAEVALPLLDEPDHPRLRRYRHAHTLAWSNRVAAADAVVLVTPEYNHGYPAALKNALDYLHVEWADKPVGFVSYGGAAGGARAVEQLRQVVVALALVSVVPTVTVPFHTQHLHDGAFNARDDVTAAATRMLHEITRMGQVLRQLRHTREAGIA